MQTDILYLGNFPGNPVPTTGTVDSPAQGTTDPVYNQGVGPAGRIFFHNVVPLTVQTNNIAVLAAPSSGVAMTLVAGTGITAVSAPDGSQATVYKLDTPRCISLTSTSVLSGINFTVVGFDMFGRKQTQTLAGPNNNTVNTKKAFASVLSVTPNGTNAGTVSIGTSDSYGMPWRVTDAGLMIRTGWAGAIADDSGTYTVADDTTPATATTGDTRGTYATSSSSNGTNRLVLAVHLDGTQCGPFAKLTKTIGVTPA